MAIGGSGPRAIYYNSGIHPSTSRTQSWSITHNLSDYKYTLVYIGMYEDRGGGSTSIFFACGPVVLSHQTPQITSPNVYYQYSYTDKLPGVNDLSLIKFAMTESTFMISIPKTNSQSEISLGAIYVYIY